MSANAIRDDRRYTPDHEWAKLEGDELLVGITAFAVDQLGDITLVSLDVGVGDSLDAKQAFGTIESVKTLSDLFAPVSGTITRLNEELEDNPELVNDDCWDKGWMVAIKPSSLDEDWPRLLDADGYQRHLESSES
jgi:glycine cleavage system H protein